MTAGETFGAQAFDTRDGFVSAVHAAMTLAAARQARRMVWVDTDFADWPIDDAGLVQGLGDWLRLPQRRLQLLAVDPEALRRRCARFMSLYRLWSHAIEVSAPAADDVPGWPCLLLVEGTVLVRVRDKQRWRGGCSTDAVTLHACREGVDALLQRSEAALPVTTLGL